MAVCARVCKGNVFIIPVDGSLALRFEGGSICKTVSLSAARKGDLVISTKVLSGINC